MSIRLYHPPGNARGLAAAILLLTLLPSFHLFAAGRKVIVDQDTRGPATSDLQAVALLLQDPSVDLLGLAVVSGDVWRDEGISHALRLLEVTGRTDVPVLPGAVFPLVHTRAESLLWEKSHTARRCSRARGWTSRPSGSIITTRPSCRRRWKGSPKLRAF